jgi:hypothetical protein
MAYNPPTDESIKFLETGAKDSFPSVYDAGTSSVLEKYTKVWAEYHNKIRNFIGVVEPLCNTDTALDEGLNSLTYWTLNPAPTLNDIILGSAVRAYNAGKSPPTTVFPFEIVITNSSDSYSNWNKFPGFSCPPMLYQKPTALINRIAFGDLFTIKPMVKCCLLSTRSDYYSTKWAINSYCITGTDTLLIRGSIIDLDGTGTVTSELPPITNSFPYGDVQKLHVTLVGAR